jgi:hypothetical protein
MGGFSKINPKSNGGIFRYITLPIIETPLAAGDAEVVSGDQNGRKRRCTIAADVGVFDKNKVAGCPTDHPAS